MRHLILAVGLIAIAVPAWAQAPRRGNAELQTYCAGDAIRCCAGINLNSSQMDACFKENTIQMFPQSPPCHRFI